MELVKGSIKVTRQIIRSIQSTTPMVQEDIFGLHIPESLEGVPTNLLNPKNVWENKSDYDLKANELAVSFHKKMKKFPSFYQSYKAGAPIFKGKTATFKIGEEGAIP